MVTKKEETLPFAKTWVDPEGIMISEISQTEKDKYYMISHVGSSKAKLRKAEGRTVTARGKQGEMRIHIPVTR